MNLAGRLVSVLRWSDGSAGQAQVSRPARCPYPTDQSLLELLAAVEFCAGCEVRELSGIVDMGLEDLKDTLAAAAAEDLVHIRETGRSIQTFFRRRAYVVLAPKGQNYLLEQGAQTTYSVRPNPNTGDGGITPPEGIRL